MKIAEPKKPLNLLKKGVIPAAFLAALSSPFAYTTLEKFEGNILHVYADKLANGLPTFCAGRTDKTATVGEKLTSDQCHEINKLTILEYGYSVLGCTTWDHITPQRLVALTMFSINVGKAAACGSRAFQLINAGQIVAGCDALALSPSGLPAWSYAGGNYVPGLQNRRQAERQICLDGMAV